MTGSATAQTLSRLAPSDLATALKREQLVGVTAAAAIVGVKAPNFKRDVAPHLTCVPVEGSADVYFRSEVRRFARQRANRRQRAANGAS